MPKPVPTQLPSGEASGSGVKRKFSTIEPPDDAALVVGAHDLSRLKLYRSLANNQIPEICLSFLDEDLWKSFAMRMANALLQNSVSEVVFSEHARVDHSLPHKLECLLKVLRNKTVLATIRHGLLKIECRAIIGSQRCIFIRGRESGSFELKNTCSSFSVTHRWLLSLAILLFCSCQIAYHWKKTY